MLAATPLLDVNHPHIEALVADRGWRALHPYDRIGAVYDFVRNEIAFGYNEGDELPASQVLAVGDLPHAETRARIQAAHVLVPAGSKAARRPRSRPSPVAHRCWPRASTAPRYPGCC